MVRFINVADATKLASLQVDGATLFDSVKAKSVTDFREVSQMRAHFTTRRAGTSDTTTLASDDKTLMDGNRDSELIVSENLFSGVTFESEAGYKDVAPSTLALEIRTKDSPKVLLRMPPMTLTRGTATTIVIHGATKLSTFVFTDAMMPAMADKD